MVRQYTRHLIESIEKAERGESKLGPAQLAVEGMSSLRHRHFLNNLCSLPNARYLEVGLYKGSTFICANYGNANLRSIGIENFSEFDDEIHHKNGRKNIEDLKENLSAHLSISDRPRTKVFITDAFKISTSVIGSINIYFYDANHSFRSQYMGLKHFASSLENPFILVVDNWDCQFRGARDGTTAALKDLQWKCRYWEELKFFNDGNAEIPDVFVAVVCK